MASWGKKQNTEHMSKSNSKWKIKKEQKHAGNTLDGEAGVGMMWGDFGGALASVVSWH